MLIQVTQLSTEHGKAKRLLLKATAAAAAFTAAHGWGAAVRPVLLPDTLCGPDILETHLELRCLLESQGLVDGVAQGVLDGG